MTTQNNQTYGQVNVSCSNCGNSFETGSTHNGDIRVEVCSNCHPAYTGQQRTLSNSGQIDKFKQRYSGNNQ